MPDLKRRAMVNGLLAAAVVAGARARADTTKMEEPLMSTPAHGPGFAETLLAHGPHPSLGKHADTFGRLIGSWAGEYRDESPGEPVETGPIEVHLGWVLQGRAVQDTWIAPPRALREGATLLKRNTYGTTIRVFHPELEAWRAVWLNPIRGERNDLIGRRVGDDIVQFCLDADRPEKWIFSRITARSFLWRAFLLGDDGVTWHVDTEFQFHRTT